MSGWQLSGDAPTAYMLFAVKVMEPWTDDLILQSNCRNEDRILDVACGTGYVASRIFAASGATCRISGIDINESMLSVAKKNTNIEWHLGSATQLPFPDASFDIVLCQQGLQYFSDRAAAMSEIARVLAPGGRVSINVWGSLDRQPLFVALVDGLVRYIPEAKTTFDLAYSLNSKQELRALAENAGLKQAKVRFEHRTIRHPSVYDFINGFMQATPVAAQF